MRSPGWIAALAPALALAVALPCAALAEEPTPPLAPATRVTFEQALEKALARNPSARQAQQEILRTEALVRETRAASLPTLTGVATGTLLDSARKLGTSTVQGQTSVNANLQLGVPLVAVQRWMSWIHSRDNAELTRVSADDVKRSLAITAARAYLAVVAQQKGLEVADRAFSTAQKHYEFSHGRRLGGVGNRLDEVRAEQEGEATRAAAEQARSTLARAQEALGVVLAEDGPVDAAPDAALPSPPTLDEALKEAGGRRIDVKVAEGRAANADQVVKDSWADYMPSLTGSFMPFIQDPPSITQPQTGWQAALVLSVPFYDGGLRYGLRQEREALLAEAKLAVESLSRQVQADVRTTFETLRRAEASLSAAQRSALLAREALDLASQAYAAGATTNLEVIDAERRARDAESSAAIAEDAARQARLDVLAASGRFP
ncbi:MAG TPA: TolC family protein [Myxococcales bacterium]|jgi:outer membrane protein TolC